MEKLIGQWNPFNKFTNIYTAIDEIQGQIEEFNERQESQPQTPTGGGGARYTPSNSRGIDSISRRASEFNNGLDRLKNKFQTMKDVEYEKTKVDLVF